MADRAAAADHTMTSLLISRTPRKVLQTSSITLKTKTLRICGRPATGFPESKSEAMVQPINRERGSRIGGNTRRRREKRSSTIPRPNRICETAIDNTMAEAAQNATQRRTGSIRLSAGASTVSGSESDSTGIVTPQHPRNGSRKYPQVETGRGVANEPNIQTAPRPIRQAVASERLPEAGEAWT